MTKGKHNKRNSEKNKGKNMIKDGFEDLGWDTLNKVTEDIPSYTKDVWEISDGIYTLVKSYKKKDGTRVRSYKRKRRI